MFARKPCYGSLSTLEQNDVIAVTVFIVNFEHISHLVLVFVNFEHVYDCWV